MYTIRDVTEDDFGTVAFCGYKNPKSDSYRNKTEWLEEEMIHGLRHTLLLDSEGEAVGGIEYAPAERAWKPVETSGYFVIDCIYIMKKDVKGSGHGARLLEACVEDARESGASGVVGIARKGSWMPDGRVFEGAGFERVDTAPPDFELWALSFETVGGRIEGITTPAFSPNAKRYASDEPGWVVYYADQCPYLAKCVPEIVKAAREEFGIEPVIRKIGSPSEVRSVPCAFGTFCITRDGKVVADRPVSKSRFRNIVNAG